MALTAREREFAERAESPVDFCRGLLGADLWATQEAILAALAKPHAKVAVKACHASGKSYTAAVACVWFMSAFPDAVVLTTAPTFLQVSSVLWKEIRDAVGRAKCKYPAPNLTDWKISAKRYALGISTNESVRFQGHHSEHVLVIVDEAPGVKADIYGAIEGVRAGGDVRLLLLGNPVIASGPFYDAFTSQREVWQTFTIAAADTPNLHGVPLEELYACERGDPRLDQNPRPYLITRRWVWERWHEWGKHGHPLWEARVLGAFPESPEGQLIPLSWVERAKLEPVSDNGGEVVAGIDVAGEGENETVVVVRTAAGGLLLDQGWAAPDPRGAVIAALRPWKERLRSVKVDVCGIGHYFALDLEGAGFKVERVNVGLAPRDGERYKNAKAEFFWALRQRFQDGALAGPLSEQMVYQLTALRYVLNARGQVEIESKEDMRARGVESPDHAEALMLSCAEPGKALGYLHFLEGQTRPDTVPEDAAPAESPAALAAMNRFDSAASLSPAAQAARAKLLQARDQRIAELEARAMGRR